jgi:hypothetical protein
LHDFVMLGMYGAWIDWSTEADVQAIKRSMEAGATAEAIHGIGNPAVRVNPLPGATKVPPKGVGKAKLAKDKEKEWRAGRQQPSLQIVEN